MIDPSENTSYLTLLHVKEFGVLSVTCTSDVYKGHTLHVLERWRISTLQVICCIYFKNKFFCNSEYVLSQQKLTFNTFINYDRNVQSILSTLYVKLLFSKCAVFKTNFRVAVYLYESKEATLFFFFWKMADVIKTF